MIERFLDMTPDTAKAAFIAANSAITGDVVLEEGSSVWYGAVLRGDCGHIRIGEKSNIQDCAILHNTEGTSCIVGNGVTVGHGAILHGCTVGDNCLIGMGSIILDDAVIAENSLVAAGSLVTGGKTFPPDSLILGHPAKVVRQLTKEEIDSQRLQADDYYELSQKTSGKL
jgi:carbonic anhydrase/acetyltransferase-like protein (isoleucine patch superfamily)